MRQKTNHSCTQVEKYHIPPTATQHPPTVPRSSPLAVLAVLLVLDSAPTCAGRKKKDKKEHLGLAESSHFFDDLGRKDAPSC